MSYIKIESDFVLINHFLPPLKLPLINPEEAICNEDKIADIFRNYAKNIKEVRDVGITYDYLGAVEVTAFCHFEIDRKNIHNFSLLTEMMVRENEIRDRYISNILSDIEEFLSIKKKYFLEK